MVLTADIGNTQSVFGIWQNKMLSTVRLSTTVSRTVDEWCWFLNQWLSEQNSQVTSVGYSSVVPRVNTIIEKAFTKLGAKEIYPVSSENTAPLKFDYEGVNTLGADRIANALAGISYYADDLVIVDFGTAITFCLVTEQTYRGGLIAPGIHSSLTALFQKTAVLPEISFRHHDSALGKNTVESIEAGAYFGYRGLLREIITELKRHPLARGRDLTVIATGGISDNLGFGEELFDVIDRNLTLKGLYALVHKND